ncbi:MAG TPA: lasso peptide biosynthesis B2 protein [Allosphingosinicella sp.]|jgi:hypothetical protein
MALTASLRSFSRLSWFQRALLAEALATLAAASLAIRLAPFRRVVQAAGSSERRASGDERHHAETIKQCRWAVGAWADRVPWRAVCFQRGLALHLMLRRRRVPSVLHYGVAQTSERGLSAHVWISSRGQIVLGGEEAGGFACLASFPAPPAA